MTDTGNPCAVFLSRVMRCEECEYPCQAKENSSYANCETHMKKLLEEGKVGIKIVWRKGIKLVRRDSVGEKHDA